MREERPGRRKKGKKERKRETEKEVSLQKGRHEGSHKRRANAIGPISRLTYLHTLCSPAEAEENRTVPIDSLGRMSSRKDITDTVTRRATQRHITSVSIARRHAARSAGSFRTG